MELSRARSRGVAVDVLMTSHAKGGKDKLVKLRQRLEETGARVHAYSDSVVKYHAKYLVADEGPAIVASLNFTRKCFERTCDALVITYDLEVVETLLRMMDTDRQGLPLDAGSSPRLIIGPEHARRQFTELIEGARSSIRLIDAKLSDPDLVSLLAARRNRGLEVERYGAKQLGEFKSHGKIMLIDDRLAVIGGLALAALSLDFQREVAIIVDESSAVEDVRALFRSARVWAAQTVTATNPQAPG